MLTKIGTFIKEDLKRFSLDSFLGSLHTSAIIGLTFYVIFLIPK